MQTVEQVLRAGQSGQRGRSLQPSLIDMNQMTRECLELARTRYHLGEEALHFSHSFDGSESTNVSGDADELRAAVSNLIDNAVKYSGDKIDVSVKVEAIDERRVMVRISDHGVGIPPGQLKRIFKRFYRVPGKVIRRIKGTGLGLFIVRSVVEKHGGRVYAESDGEGLGSTFTILLPRARER
jgi:signal transduction histidine kinase